MEGLIQDFKQAARSLARSPGLVIVAVLSLALGIGVNATVFSCVNALFLRPWPYKDQDRLMAIWETVPARGINQNSVSYANFADWRQNSSGSFEGMAAYYGSTLNLAAADEPERIEGQYISWNTFRLLGINPMLGRDFLEEEERPNGPKVAILSAIAWHRLFRSDSAAIGKAIVVNGDPYTIVGVMPPPHQFPDDSQIWLPITLDPTRARANHFLAAMGKLKPGVTPEAAQQDLDRTAKRLAETYPETNKDWTVSVTQIREDEVGDYGNILTIMMAAVGFVLLIACANVANLLLARATGRGRDVAVRTALGAGKWQIARQMLAESLLLSLGGAALGLVVARWGLNLLVAQIPADKPFWMVFTIDIRVLLYTIGAATITGILFGLVPVIQTLRSDLHESLKEGSRGAGTGGHRHRLRNTLVVSEVALSTVLLIGAALMIRSFMSLQQVSPGFDARNMMTFFMSLQGSRFDSAATRQVFYDDILGRLRGLPGVSSVGMSQAPPLSGSRSTSSFLVEGGVNEVGRLPFAAFQNVSAGYVSHLGVELKEGRDISEQDMQSRAKVVLVGETMAKRFWPNESAIGHRIQVSSGTPDPNEWLTIVGVTADIRQQRLSDRPENQVYRPYALVAGRGMGISIRASGDLVALFPAIRTAIRAADPTLPVDNLQTMDAVIRFSMWEQRLYSGMFGSFAIAALILAAAGLYGVMSYLVSLRTREIGVRMALGAGRGAVLNLVVGRGVTLAGIGLVIGLVGAFGMTRALASLLFGVGTLDPMSFVGIPLMLLGVAIVASWIPARRATVVDPVVVLRSE